MAAVHVRVAIVYIYIGIGGNDVVLVQVLQHEVAEHGIQRVARQADGAFRRSGLDGQGSAGFDVGLLVDGFGIQQLAGIVQHLDGHVEGRLHVGRIGFDEHEVHTLGFHDHLGVGIAIGHDSAVGTGANRAPHHGHRVVDHPAAGFILRLGQGHVQPDLAGSILHRHETVATHIHALVVAASRDLDLGDSERSRIPAAVLILQPVVAVAIHGHPVGAHLVPDILDAAALQHEHLGGMHRLLRLLIIDQSLLFRLLDAGSVDLVGIIDLAVELGGEARLHVHHEAAVGQIHRVGDPIALVVVARAGNDAVRVVQGHGVQLDAINRAGDGHRGRLIRAVRLLLGIAEAQHQLAGSRDHLALVQVEPRIARRPVREHHILHVDVARAFEHDPIRVEIPGGDVYRVGRDVEGRRKTCRSLSVPGRELCQHRHGVRGRVDRGQFGAGQVQRVVGNRLVLIYQGVPLALAHVLVPVFLDGGSADDGLPFRIQLRVAILIQLRQIAFRVEHQDPVVGKFLGRLLPAATGAVPIEHDDSVRADGAAVGIDRAVGHTAVVDDARAGLAAEVGAQRGVVVVRAMDRLLVHDVIHEAFRQGFIRVDQLRTGCNYLLVVGLLAHLKAFAPGGFDVVRSRTAHNLDCQVFSRHVLVHSATVRTTELISKGEILGGILNSAEHLLVLLVVVGRVHFAGLEEDVLGIGRVVDGHQHQIRGRRGEGTGRLIPAAAGIVRSEHSIYCLARFAAVVIHPDAGSGHGIVDDACSCGLALEVFHAAGALILHAVDLLLVHDVGHELNRQAKVFEDVHLHAGFHGLIVVGRVFLLHGHAYALDVIRDIAQLDLNGVDGGCHVALQVDRVLIPKLVDKGSFRGGGAAQLLVHLVVVHNVKLLRLGVHVLGVGHAVDLQLRKVLVLLRAGEIFALPGNDLDQLNARDVAIDVEGRLDEEVSELPVVIAALAIDLGQAVAVFIQRVVAIVDLVVQDNPVSSIGILLQRERADAGQLRPAEDGRVVRALNHAGEVERLALRVFVVQILVAVIQLVLVRGRLVDVQAELYLLLFAIDDLVVVQRFHAFFARNSPAEDAAFIIARLNRVLILFRFIRGLGIGVVGDVVGFSVVILLRQRRGTRLQLDVADVHEVLIGLQVGGAPLVVPLPGLIPRRSVVIGLGETEHVVASVGIDLVIATASLDRDPGCDLLAVLTLVVPPNPTGLLEVPEDVLQGLVGGDTGIAALGVVHRHAEAVDGNDIQSLPGIAVLILVPSESSVCVHHADCLVGTREVVHGVVVGAVPVGRPAIHQLPRRIDVAVVMAQHRVLLRAGGAVVVAFHILALVQVLEAVLVLAFI